MGGAVSLLEYVISGRGNLSLGVRYQWAGLSLLEYVTEWAGLSLLEYDTE